MMSKTWNLIRSRLDHAGRLGEEYAAVTGPGDLPIDPFAIAESESPLLKYTAEDFGDAFDGQLEYHRKHNRFLLYLNTKYDAEQLPGQHHPRTRFSLAHELAHYFLDTHRAYLMGGGATHGSQSEFKSDAIVEQEADAFAAGLLMPSKQFGLRVNREAPNFRLIREAALEFKTSIVSSAIRTIQLSHFPCALACICQSSVAWTFCSQPLIDAGCYPAERGLFPPANGVAAWKELEDGRVLTQSNDGTVGDWFRTYGDTNRHSTYVAEQYLAIPVMHRLLVLLSLDENDIIDDDE